MRRFIRNFFCFAAILIFCQQTALAQPGYISTIAGTGVFGYSGDGGPATAAEMAYPAEAALDASGNLYFVDYRYHVVRKISTLGIITTIAGTGTPGYSGDGGPATAAQMNQPQAIAVDAVGNIYIGEGNNYVVRKIDALGIITTFVGNNIVGFSGDGGPATAAQIAGVVNITVDVSGNIYIVDEQNLRIRKITPAGVINTVAGTGVAGYNGDGIPATNAKLNWARDVATDAAGNLYIADCQNNRVRKVNSAGIISTVVGTGSPIESGDAGSAISAGSCGPYNVSFDQLGNMYICENNRYIRKVNTLGVINMFAGMDSTGFSGDGGPALAAKFDIPAKPLIDNELNVYVPDFFNHRIRKINGIPTLISPAAKQAHSFTVYPNPFKNEITLSGNANIEEVMVFNIVGKNVATLKGNKSNEMKVSLDFLQAGAYFISVNNGNSITIVKE